jgi:predicted Zn-dependent protease with MMP-like domain
MSTPTSRSDKRRRRSTPQRRRDRRGRGLRGALAPRAVPLTRAPSEAFDDLVLDAIEELESHWAGELSGVEFAVQDVPPAAEKTFDPLVIADRGVPLGRLDRTPAGTPLILIYRRPLEARAADRQDRGDLVFSVVAELVAEALGKDLDELDPPD